MSKSVSLPEYPQFLDASSNNHKIAYKHYIRALTRWPVDLLRPNTQFKDVFRKTIDNKFVPGAAPVNESLELEQVNALYSLLEDRYKKKVRRFFSLGWQAARRKADFVASIL